MGNSTQAKSRKSRISPEARRAIQVLLTNVSKYRSKLVHSLPSTPLPSDFIAFCNVPIKCSSLPRQSGWSWRQSNSRIPLTLPDGGTASLAKLSPRKLDGGSSEATVPRGKAWVAEIKGGTTGHCWFVWVEQGPPQTDRGPSLLQRGAIQDTVRVNGSKAKVKDATAQPPFTRLKALSCGATPLAQRNPFFLQPTPAPSISPSYATGLFTMPSPEQPTTSRAASEERSRPSPTLPSLPRRALSDFGRLFGQPTHQPAREDLAVEIQKEEKMDTSSSPVCFDLSSESCYLDGSKLSLESSLEDLGFPNWLD